MRGPVIGVTGHRHLLSSDTGRIRAAVRQALTAIQGPGVTLVSPLAEGADRLIAAEGLALGFSLVALLPFAYLEYERDFNSLDSVAEFRTLIALAGTVEELPGLRAEEGAAYEAVGRRVLGLSDGLVAVWDGLPARGRGGTAQVLAEAGILGLPIWWVPLKGNTTEENPSIWAAAVYDRYAQRVGGTGLETGRS